MGKHKTGTVSLSSKMDHMTSFIGKLDFGAVDSKKIIEHPDLNPSQEENPKYMNLDSNDDSDGGYVTPPKDKSAIILETLASDQITPFSLISLFDAVFAGNVHEVGYMISTETFDINTTYGVKRDNLLHHAVNGLMAKYEFGYDKEDIYDFLLVIEWILFAPGSDNLIDKANIDGASFRETIQSLYDQDVFNSTSNNEYYKMINEQFAKLHFYHSLVDKDSKDPVDGGEEFVFNPHYVCPDFLTPVGEFGFEITDL